MVEGRLYPSWKALLASISRPVAASRERARPAALTRPPTASYFRVLSVPFGYPITERGGFLPPVPLLFLSLSFSLFHSPTNVLSLSIVHTHTHIYTISLFLLQSLPLRPSPWGSPSLCLPSCCPFGSIRAHASLLSASPFSRPLSQSTASRLRLLADPRVSQCIIVIEGSSPVGRTGLTLPRSGRWVRYVGYSCLVRENANNVAGTSLNSSVPAHHGHRIEVMLSTENDATTTLSRTSKVKRSGFHVDREQHAWPSCLDTGKHRVALR